MRPVCVYIAILFVCANSFVSAREFKDNTGRTIEAELLKVRGTMVAISVKGKTHIVPLTKFSEEDQTFITKWAEERGESVGATVLGGNQQDSGNANTRPRESGVDWPRYRGPNRDGISNEGGLSHKPEEMWRAKVGIGISAVSVVGNKLYTMGNDGNDQTFVYCLDANTGEEIWKQGFASPSAQNNFPGGGTPFPGGPTSTPTVDGGKVYVLGRFGKLICFDADAGSKVWEFDYNTVTPQKGNEWWGFSASPHVVEDRVYIEPGGAMASMVCLNKETGEAVWQTGADPAGYSTPLLTTFGEQKVLLTFNQFGLVGKNPEDGADLFRYFWKTTYGANAASPVLVGMDRIFISSGYGSGCALLKYEQGNLTSVWKNKNMRNKHSSSVFVGDHLYGFDESTLVCLDVEKGEIQWQQRGYGKGSLIYADNKLFIQSERSNFLKKASLLIIKASPLGFQFLNEIELFESHAWTMPVISNKRIFCRDVQGNLVALSLKQG